MDKSYLSIYLSKLTKGTHQVQKFVLPGVFSGVKLNFPQKIYSENSRATP